MNAFLDDLIDHKTRVAKYMRVAAMELFRMASVEESCYPFSGSPPLQG